MKSVTENSGIPPVLHEEDGKFAVVTPICAINPFFIAYMKESILRGSMREAEYVRELGEHIVTISPARKDEEHLGSSYLLYVEGKQKIFHYHPLDVTSDVAGPPRAAHRRLTFTPVGGDAEIVFFLGENESKPLSKRMETFILKEGAIYEVVFGGKEQKGHLVHAFGSTKENGVIIFESVHRADSVAGGVDALVRQSVVYQGKLPRNKVTYEISPPETPQLSEEKLRENIEWAERIATEQQRSEIKVLFDVLAPKRVGYDRDVEEAKRYLPVYDQELRGHEKDPSLNPLADHLQRPSSDVEFLKKILGLTGEKPVPFFRR